jgi:hypothetical protein
VVATGVFAAMSATLFLLISLTLVAVHAYTGNFDFIYFMFIASFVLFSYFLCG